MVFAPIAYAAVLYSLAHSVVQVSLRKGFQKIGVSYHRPRLFERPDEILSRREVDTGLSAYRRVYL